ncbi:MAG: 16S rRNA (cytidine(1402)-2'-O)-methyltransferase [Bacilli bacterium]
MIIRNKPFKTKGSGLIYLVGVPIGNILDFSERGKQILSEADIVACEDTRKTGLLLSRLGIKAKKLVSCYAQKELEKSKQLVDEVKNKDLMLAFVSDAGMPGISDPGALLIQQAVINNVPVSSVAGPCALIQALVVSGFNTADFSFFGFLPAKKNNRRKMLEELNEKSETLIFYEAPHRIFDVLEDMKEIFGNDRKVCVCREISKIFEEYIRGTLEEVVSVDSNTLKGEFVIVIEGKQIRENENGELEKDIITYAKKLVKAGYKNSEVAKILSIEFNEPKNKLYKLINDL